MTPEKFEAVVREALEALPEEIAELVQQVAIVVEAHPTPEQLEDQGMDDPMGLYGLYEGVPLPERSLLESGTLPDRITIFREPLEADFTERDELILEIQKTVAHEIAHVFGIDEDRLEELGLD